MNVPKRAVFIIAAVLFSCGVMAVVDAVISPHYIVKSAVKLLLFLTLPLLFRPNLKPLFQGSMKGFALALGLALPLYGLILGGYWALKDVFDFSNVTASLTGNIGVTRDNFVFVAIYISFVNSLLEEFFFRGFAYRESKKYFSPKWASVFSAAAFALYHIAMMGGWFSAGVFAITLVGLFVGGLIFNYLNDRGGSIYPSWFLHMSANFAINTIGFILFGIL